jgi:hypothetical protein
MDGASQLIWKKNAKEFSLKRQGGNSHLGSQLLLLCVVEYGYGADAF